MKDPRVESFWRFVATDFERRLDLLRQLVDTPAVKPSARHPRRSISALVVGARCWCCAVVEAVHWHHIIPVSCGGVTVGENLVPLCARCHYAAHAGVQRRYYLVRGVSRPREKVIIRPSFRPNLSLLEHLRFNGPQNETEEFIDRYRPAGVCLADLDPNRTTQEQIDEIEQRGIDKAVEIVQSGAWISPSEIRRMDAEADQAERDEWRRMEEGEAEELKE